MTLALVLAAAVWTAGILLALWLERGDPDPFGWVEWIALVLWPVTLLVLAVAIAVEIVRTRRARG